MDTFNNNILFEKMNDEICKIPTNTDDYLNKIVDQQLS